jgi:hypothetical protein
VSGWNQWKREMRVAFSRKAQPLWFRVLKWTIALGIGVWTRQTQYFWRYVGGGLVFCLAVHFFWRWKTKGWTQPWGGWSDVKAGLDR